MCQRPEKQQDGLFYGVKMSGYQLPVIPVFQKFPAPHSTMGRFRAFEPDASFVVHKVKS
jgi:hypothetical protein